MPFKKAVWFVLMVVAPVASLVTLTDRGEWLCCIIFVKAVSPVVTLILAWRNAELASYSRRRSVPVAGLGRLVFTFAA